MQTELAIHRATNGRLPPLWMLDQGAALDPLGERATVGLSLPAFLGLETMQLPVMPDQWSNANQPFVIGGSLSPDRGSRQHPGVYAMGFPDLCQLFARFFEAQLIPQGLGLVALFCLDGCQLAEFRVEPLLAYLQRGKALIPLLFATRGGLDVLYHEDTDRKKLAEKAGQAQFPLPACPGRGRQFFPALTPVWPGLTARRFSSATSTAHPARVLFRFLDSLPGLRLDIDIGMRRRDDAIALALAAGIDPHGDGLDLPRCWLDVEPDAKDAPFPEGRRPPALDPFPGSRRSRGHEWVLILPDNRYKHKR